MIPVLRSARTGGLKAKKLREAGLRSCKDFFSAGYTASDLKDAGFEAVDVFSAGYSSEEMAKAGFSMELLQNFKAERRKQFMLLKKQRKFTVEQIMQEGFGVDEVMQQLTEEDFKDRDVISTLKRASVNPAKLAKRGSTLNVLAKAGFNARSLKKIDYFFTQPEGPQGRNVDREFAMLKKLKEKKHIF